MKTKRILIRAGVAAALAAGTAAAWASDLMEAGATPRVLGEGYRFTEGPAADARGAIYFTDIPNGRIHRWEPGQAPRVFMENLPGANGLMFGPDGALLACEGTGHRVMAYDVATRQGKARAGGGATREFNEPNDLAVDRHGGIYFTDPCYGHGGQKAVRKEDVYYIATNGTVTCVSTVCRRPNGVLLSADEKTLFVADNAAQVMYRYDIRAPGVLTNETKWVDVGGSPDGMTLDADGRLYVACGGAGVRVFSPEGIYLETVFAGYASNCCFGGPDFKTLFITARDRVMGLRMKVRGVLPHPARAAAAEPPKP